MKPSRRDLTLKGLERTLNQIYLENYALHKARPYPIIEEETGTMIAADGGEEWHSHNIFILYVSNSDRYTESDPISSA